MGGRSQHEMVDGSQTYSSSWMVLLQAHMWRIDPLSSSIKTRPAAMLSLAKTSSMLQRWQALGEEADDASSDEQVRVDRVGKRALGANGGLLIPSYHGLSLVHARNGCSRVPVGGLEDFRGV